MHQHGHSNQAQHDKFWPEENEPDIWILYIQNKTMLKIFSSKSSWLVGSRAQFNPEATDAKLACYDGHQESTP